MNNSQLNHTAFSIELTNYVYNYHRLITLSMIYDINYYDILNALG